MAKDLNDYIKRSHIVALERFKADLDKYKELLDPDGTLYEDPSTSFTVDNIILVDGCLHYDYNGKPKKDVIIRQDEETGEYYEYSLMKIVNYWAQCLSRALFYWNHLPVSHEAILAIQNAEAEHHERKEE